MNARKARSGRSGTTEATALWSLRKRLDGRRGRKVVALLPLMALLLLVLSPVSGAWARPPCEDTGTCPADRQPPPPQPTTVPPAAAEPTVAPESIEAAPTSPPESIEVIGADESLPTDDLPRAGDYSIIVIGPAWNPLGYMPIDRSYQEWQDINWWVVNKPTNHAKYGQAVRDRDELWSFYASGGYQPPQQNNEEQASPVPAEPVATDQPAPRESSLCTQAKADLVTAQTRLDKANAAMRLADQAYNNALGQIEIEQNALTALQAEYDALKADLRTLRGEDLKTQMALMAAKQAEINRQRDVVIPAAKQAAIQAYGDRDKALGEQIDAGANFRNQQKLVDLYCNQGSAAAGSAP